MPDLWRQNQPGTLQIGGAGIVPIGGEVNHNVAGAAETFEITKTANALYLVVRGEVGTHRIRPGLLNARVFTVSSVPNNEFSDTDHGFVTGDGPLRVSNSGGALPAGLLVDTDYWVFKVDDDTFQLATTPGAVNRIALDQPLPTIGTDPIVQVVTTAGTGTQSIGGDAGTGNAVGFAPANPPAADVTTGEGSVPLLANEVIIYSGRALTVRATAMNDVLTWWEI